MGPDHIEDFFVFLTAVKICLGVPHCHVTYYYNILLLQKDRVRLLTNTLEVANIF